MQNSYFGQKGCSINVFKNKSETIVRVPVSFIHIIKNTMGQQNLNSKSIIDVTPLEAYELIEHYMSNLEKNYYGKIRGYMEEKIENY